MVAIYDFLWLRYIDYAKKYQLQIDAVNDFNSKIDEVQREIISILSEYYQKNDKVRTLLSPFTRRLYDQSDQNGQILFPQRVGVEEQTTEEYYRLLGLGITDENGKILFSVDKTDEDELIYSYRVPQRKPNADKNAVYYLQYNSVIQLYPEEQFYYVLYYLIYPTTATLVFTYNIVDGEYVQTHDQNSTIDLQWDKNASNLLLYMLLEKYGISSRDELLSEFGRFGVQFSLKNPQK